MSASLTTAARSPSCRNPEPAKKMKNRACERLLCRQLGLIGKSHRWKLFQQTVPFFHQFIWFQNWVLNFIWLFLQRTSSLAIRAGDVAALEQLGRVVRWYWSTENG